MQPNHNNQPLSTDDKIRAAGLPIIGSNNPEAWYSPNSLKWFMKSHLKVVVPVVAIVALLGAGGTTSLVMSRKDGGTVSKPESTNINSESASLSPIDMIANLTGSGSKASKSQTSSQSSSSSNNAQSKPNPTKSATTPKNNAVNPSKSSDSNGGGTVPAPAPAPIPTPTPKPTPPPAPTPTTHTLHSTSFDNFTSASPMILSEYKTAMGDAGMAAYNGNLVYTSIVSVSGRGKVMRQTFPANTYGTSYGIVTFPRLSKTVDEATIQYDIRFSSGFDWSLGGKLPGLGGATSGTGPGIASGCNAPSPNAWSGRGMWSRDKWIGYMYNPTKKSDCGDGVTTNRAFTSGGWHTVKQYYKMNTVGQSNGIHRMWFDGQQVVNRTNFVYRTNPNVRINYVFWSLFRGGSTPDWKGSTTGYIDFDNLVITGA